MRILLLLCFAGFAFGFQPTLRYKYHYQGVSETGIPEINTEGAAVGIQLDAIMEVSEDGHAVIHFENMKAGEHHGCLGCNRDHPISENEYYPITDDPIYETVMQPFEANLYGNEDYSMLVETEEILWLRNIRRAIIGIFRNFLLQGNFDNCGCSHTKLIKSGVIPKVFSLKEETIMGKCEVHYTVHKIEGSLAEEYNHKLESNFEGEIDVQRDDHKSAALKTSKKKTSKKYSSKKSRKTSKHGKTTSKYSRKGSVPELEDDLYHVTRTINFDNCEHNVFLRHSSGGFNFKAGGSTQSWYGARSSVSEYFFRGSGGAFRMEGAIVEGVIAAKALGHAKERMSAFTKQTVQLKSVEEVTHPVHISPSVQIHGWMHELLSPHPEPKVSAKVPWVTYTGDENLVDGMEVLTGVKATAEEIATRKVVLVQCIKFVAKAFSAEKASEEVDPAIVMDNLKAIKVILETLPTDAILDVMNDVMVEDSTRPHEVYQGKILVDGLVASGTRRAANIILKLIKTKKISSFQSMLIAATGMNSLYEVTAIPDMADFITELSLQEEPFVASTVLVNFAQMVHHYCVVPEASRDHYGGALFGDEGCNVEHLKNNFTPYLTKIINDESKSWERIIAIKVVHRLGISSTVGILGPVALGQKGACDQLRTTAIYALSRWTLPWSARDHAMQVLSEIFTNPGELPRVRMAAIIMYSSWGPEPAFYYRLARLSWREPSMAIASFYYSLIKATAEGNHPMFVTQGQAAGHALKIARPTVNFNRYPSVSRDFEMSLQNHESKILELGLFHFPYPEPDQNFGLFSYIGNSINGMHMTVSEMFISGGGMGEFIKNTFATYETNDVHSKVVEDLYKKIQDVIQAEPTGHREPLVTAYLRVFENTQFLLPLTKETLQASQMTDPIYLASLLLELQAGLSRSLGKFFTLASIREVLPNEMGLPVYTAGGGYIAFADTFNARLSLSTSSMTEMPKKAHLFVEEYMKLMTEVSSEMNIIVPWSNSKIVTTVRSIRGLLDPVMTTIDGDFSSKSKHPELRITRESAYDDKFSIMKATTIPQSRIESLTLTGGRKASVMTLVKHKKNVREVKNIPHEYTGLAHTLTWDAQFRYPYDMLGLVQLAGKEGQSEMSYLLSSDTARYWSLELEHDVQKSDTNNVTLGFTFQLAGKDHESEDISQVSQTSGNFDYGQAEFTDYGQQQFNYDDQEFQEVDLSNVEDHGGVSIDDNFQQKSAKMTEHYGDKASSVGITLGYYGDNTREYELFYSWSKPVYANMRRKVKSQLTFLRSPIPGIDHNSLSVCLDTQKVTPVLSAFDTLDTVFDRNLDAEVTRTITPQCEGKPVVTAETTIKMSPKRMEKIRREISNDCKFDEYDPMHLFYQAVYDDVTTKIKWEDVCDKKRLPILTKAIGFLDRTFIKGMHGTCDAKDATNQLDLHLHRCTETDLWYFKAERDSSSFHVDALPGNEFLDFFLSTRFVSAERLSQLEHFGETSDKCVIKHGSVRTFDGVVYNYEPTQCWSVAAKDCKNDRFLVLVRASTTESTIPEVRIIDRENSVVINNIHGEKPDQNGVTEHFSKFGKLAVKVFKRHDHYIVLLPHRVQVTITDQVQINMLHDEACGICSTKDTEKLFEFMGPKYCVYSEPQDFVNSWTAGGETCNMYEMLEKRTEVEEYQKTCLSVYQLFKMAPRSYPINTEYAFLARTIGKKYCVSSNALPSCSDGYFSMNSNTIHTTFKCWKKDKAPQVIRSTLEKGDEHIFSPVDHRSSSTETSLVTIDVSCFKKIK